MKCPRNQKICSGVIARSIRVAFSSAIISVGSDFHAPDPPLLLAGVVKVGASVPHTQALILSTRSQATAFVQARELKFGNMTILGGTKRGK